jgi:membrane protein YqaA with SNARE-associated domain
LICAGCEPFRHERLIVSAYLAMAAAAFLAATLIPAQSEIVFAGLIAAGSADPVRLFIVASLANTAGSVVNWFLGRLIADHGFERLPARLQPDPKRLEQARSLFARHGWLTLLLSWVPIIGDPLTLAAGLMRYPLWRFCLIVLIAKAGRYGALWAGMAAAS